MSLSKFTILSSCFTFLILVGCKVKQSVQVDASQTKTKSEEEIIPSFEGKILYDMVHLSKLETPNKEQSDLTRGNEYITIIKKNRYKCMSNGTLGGTSYYLGRDTLFSKSNEDEFLVLTDVTKNEDEIISYNITKNVKKVLGIKCDLLSVISKEGTTQYYYNTDYAINIEDYSTHNFVNWKFFIEKTGSLPLKSIVDNKWDYVELTVTKILPMLVKENEFELPNLPLEDVIEE